jgi:hypothetical protein
MPEDQNKLLLQCWTVAYEKAIVAKEYKLAKKTIDKACCEAVEYLTQRLLEAESITAEDTVNRSQETMEDSIRHHIDNLTKGGMFNPDQKLNIEARTLQIEERTEKVVEITVDNCTYQEGCKWALGEPVFRENGQYRCQRLGCFVGAVKKYMTEENLPEDKRKKLDYLMTTVMESTDEYQKAGINCQCKGFIVVNENFTRQSLLQDNPTQLPT